MVVSGRWCGDSMVVNLESAGVDVFESSNLCVCVCVSFYTQVFATQSSMSQTFHRHT